MKKIILILILFLFTIYSFVHSDNNSDILKNEDDKFTASHLIVLTKSNSYIYEEQNQNSEKIAKVLENTELEVLKSIENWFFVLDPFTSEIGWIEKTNLLIPKDPLTNKKRENKESIEKFINNTEFSSKTSFFIWVDIDRQLTYIFKGSKNNWVLIKTFESATGINESPTYRGVFELRNRGTGFYSKRFKSGAKYWVRYSGSYLFHSVATDKYGNIIDNTIGKRASNGCIRFALDDAKWFYDNILDDTKVLIR